MLRLCLLLGPSAGSSARLNAWTGAFQVGTRTRTIVRNGAGEIKCLPMYWQ